MSHPQPHSHVRLIVVQDQQQPCPYRDGVIARMPLRLPVGNVTPEVTDRLHAMGFRRSGEFVYRTQCPTCDACKPTRVVVNSFQMTRSMRRVNRRGDRDLTCRWGAPIVDSNRIQLFNQHRLQRDLGAGCDAIDAASYRAFLSETCCDSRELAIYRQDRLVAIAIVDLGRIGVSAVYTYFDPAEGKFSLGTYAILKQIEFAAQTDRQFVYLGMYVADNRHLNYKGRFLPQQRRIGDSWIDSERALVVTDHGKPLAVRPQANKATGK